MEVSEGEVAAMSGVLSHSVKQRLRTEAGASQRTKYPSQERRPRNVVRNENVPAEIGEQVRVWSVVVEQLNIAALCAAGRV